jgi:lysophospholipase L1-like esterase
MLPRLARSVALALVIAPMGCGDDGGGGADTTTGVATGPATGDDSPGSNPSTSPSSADASSGGMTSATGQDTTGEEGSESSGGPPAEPAVHWVGRYDDSDPGARRMGWSGAGFVVRFDGTGASVTMDDASRYLTVVVDGVVQPTLATSAGMQTYPLAQGLPAGEHVVEMYRRTEGSFGTTVIESVDLEGELLAPPPVTRRVEIIGDSITAGYGDEGVSPCSFSAETENHFLTYGAVAARALGAELHTVAWSGKGLVNNYGDDTFEPMPEIYDRTVATDPAAWDFSWQADAVVINLGTNDFSTDGDPSEQVFVPAYVEFLGHLRDVYPGAYLLVIAPSLFGAEVDLVAGYLQDAVAQRMAAGDPDVGFADINVEWIGSGCDGHPTVATHAGMADNLQSELATRLGW